MSKILITTGIFPTDIGGPASYAMALATQISAGGEVTILTYSSMAGYKKNKSMPFKVVRVWRGIPKFLRHTIYFFYALNLAKKTDVVYSLNAVSAGLPALWAARFRKKKFFVKVVGDYAWETAANRGRTPLLLDDFQKFPKKGWIAMLNKIQTNVCKKASGVIVPSEYLAHIVEGWGVNKNNIHLVYNGVDFQTTSLSREEARKKIGIPGIIILSVGRLVPWKGFRMLIKIMPQLLEINHFFRLVIAGSGPEKKALDSMIRNMGLHNKVYLAGKKSRDELAIYMAAADVFVLNTGYEGFSHQILEAMACSLPIITTAVGGNREVVNQGENGFMIKYNDEFNLVEAIKTVWQDNDLRQQFSKEAKKTTSRFGEDKMYEETIKVLNQ